MGTRGQIAFLILLVLAVYGGTAVYSPLLDDADSVHAEAAREMAAGGDWATLRINNGIRYLEKAPLLYWMMAASFKLFGVGEFTARLPLILGVLAFTLVMYAFGRFAFGPRAGFYAGLAGATSFGVFLFTRILIPEIWLAVFISSALLCFMAGQMAPLEERAARHQYVTDPASRPSALYYGMYASMALAVLTKGLIGAVLPAGIIGLYLLLSGQLRVAVLRRMRLGSGLLLFIVIAAPWHLLAGLRNEKFFWFYFVNEHFMRYLGKRVPQDYGTVPLLLFWGLHLVWLFPWTPFLLMAVRDFPRRLRPQHDRDRILLLLWIWALLVIAFFSFSTRQEYYTFPAYPALVLLAVQVLSERELFPGPVLKWAHAALFLVAAVAAAALAALVRMSLATTVSGDISSVLTSNPDYYALSLGHMFDLTPEAFAALRWPAVGAAAVLLAGSFAALHFRLKRRALHASISLALMAGAFFFCAQSALRVFGPYLSSRELARALHSAAGPADRIVVNGEYESGSTLNFYTGRQLYILNGRSANLWWGSYYADAPQIFLDDSGIEQMWRGPERVFLFTPDEQTPKLRNLLGDTRIFARSGGKTILVNR